MHQSYELGWLLAGMSLLCIMTASCYPPSSPTPSPTHTPTCYLQPQPTMERIRLPTMVVAPPSKVHPGQTLHIQYSGGYVALNHAERCGDKTVGYIFGDDLPTPQLIRSLRVVLDGTGQAWYEDGTKLASSVDCTKDCQAEIVIPSNVVPGQHRLSLVTPWMSATVFDIEIVDPGTPIR